MTYRQFSKRLRLGQRFAAYLVDDMSIVLDDLDRGMSDMAGRDRIYSGLVWY